MVQLRPCFQMISNLCHSIVIFNNTLCAISKNIFHKTGRKIKISADNIYTKAVFIIHRLTPSLKQYYETCVPSLTFCGFGSNSLFGIRIMCFLSMVIIWLKMSLQDIFSSFCHFWSKCQKLWTPLQPVLNLDWKQKRENNFKANIKKKRNFDTVSCYVLLFSGLDAVRIVFSKQLAQEGK